MANDFGWALEQIREGKCAKREAQSNFVRYSGLFTADGMLFVLRRELKDATGWGCASILDEVGVDDLFATDWCLDSVE